MYFAQTELLKLLGVMFDLCGSQDRYTLHMAADIWGKEIDPRNPNAKRFDLSGALLAAVDQICDPQAEHKNLKKLEVSAIESKRTYAKRLLRHRGSHAKVLYGYGWAILQKASEEVTGEGLWEEKTFQTAMDVLERCKLRLCESLGIRNRDAGLGLARPSDPYASEELLLLEKITSAGEKGYTIEPRELLACYDLHRRGLIVDTWPVPWTYRRRVLYT